MPSYSHFIMDVSLSLKMSWFAIFCQCLSGFLPYSQDSNMCCSLQPYLQKPKYFDLCNYTYILVIKRCKFRASCPTSVLKKQSLIFFIAFCDLHELIFLVMFLTTLSAKYAEFFCLLKISFLLSHETSLSGCFVGLRYFFLQSVQPVNLNHNTSIHQ